MDKIRLSAKNSRDPGVAANALNNMGVALKQAGIDEAKDIFFDALEISRAALLPRSLFHVTINLARFCIIKREFQEARRVCQDAIGEYKIFRKSGGDSLNRAALSSDFGILYNVLLMLKSEVKFSF